MRGKSPLPSESTTWLKCVPFYHLDIVYKYHNWFISLWLCCLSRFYRFVFLLGTCGVFPEWHPGAKTESIHPTSYTAYDLPQVFPCTILKKNLHHLRCIKEKLMSCIVITINPHFIVSYAWDEPILNPSITLRVKGGTSATYDMDKLEEGKQLCYPNFIYLRAAASFGRLLSFLLWLLLLRCTDFLHVFCIYVKFYRSPTGDETHRELVLEVVQDQYIKFCKKVKEKIVFISHCT